MKHLTKSILFATIITALSLAVFPAAAQIKPLGANDCGPLGIQCQGNENADSLVQFIVTIILIFLTLVGIIAAAFIIWGGVQYIRSAGDESQTAAAKRTILYAVIGLIVVALAGFIVQFTLLAPRGQVGALPAIIWTIVNVFLILSALVAAIFIVLGGVKYVTSQGNEQDAAAAKSTILYAVIGLIVIGLAAALVNFVILAV